MPQMIEVDANPLSTGKLECRDEIAVTSDDDECSDHVSKRQPGNVEADAQIDPFSARWRARNRKNGEAGDSSACS